MQTNADSDCDISEDEDCVSIAEPGDEKEQLQLLLKLERLQGEQHALKFPPVFNAKRFDEDSRLDSSRRPNGAYSWSPMNKEVKDLKVINDSATSSLSHVPYSKACASSKGIRGKAKSKFTYHSHRREVLFPDIREDRFNVSSKIHNLSDTFDAIVSRTEKYRVAECLEDFVEEAEAQFHVGSPEIVCGNTESSVVELLDNLQDKAGLLGGCVKLPKSQVRGQRVPIIEMKTLVSLGDRRDGSEDSHTSLDSESSSDYEDNDQMKLALPVPNTKQQTITDRFEKALVAAGVDNEITLDMVPNPLGIGLFGKLQRIMQSEKEREVEVLNGLNSSSIPNGCIDVKILSRYLDAKLTVCSCLFIEMEKSPLSNGEASEGEKLTVIFSPRVCSNVELEIDNLIRISPPWKKVSVDHAHNLILSTYFSQLN